MRALASPSAVATSDQTLAGHADFNCKEEKVNTTKRILDFGGSHFLRGTSRKGPNECLSEGRMSTGFSSEIGTKLRESAVGQAGGSCYSRAALSSNDSKTL